MRSFLAAVVAVTWLSASSAFAQSPTIILQPERPARWDAAVHIGWLGVNKAPIAPEWNDWYQAASAGVSAGYYLTPNLKLEFDVARGTEGRVYSYQIGFVPGPPRQDEFRATIFSPTISYQFFENTWFHPFVATGVDVVHESARVRFADYFVGSTPLTPPILVPGQVSDWETSVKIHPMVAAGFKWYVAERAFIRGDLRTAFSGRQSEMWVWRVGVGFDF